jgi:hypothetical protein
MWKLFWATAERTILSILVPPACWAYFFHIFRFIFEAFVPAVIIYNFAGNKNSFSTWVALAFSMQNVVKHLGGFLKHCTGLRC